MGVFIKRSGRIWGGGGNRRCMEVKIFIHSFRLSIGRYSHSTLLNIFSNLTVIHLFTHEPDTFQDFNS